MLKKSVCILIFFTIFLFSFFNGPIFSGENDETKLDKQIEDGKKIIKELDDLMEGVNEYALTRALLCIQAFGHIKFCSCLSEKLPISLDIVDYVRIVNYEKNEKILKIRDQCVQTLK